MDNKHNSLQFGCENMLGYLSLDIICSSKLTVFLELRSRKTVRFSEQMMSADKYPSIFSRQMKAIVYLLLSLLLLFINKKITFINAYQHVRQKARFLLEEHGA